MTIPADALHHDPVDQFDRRWHDRSYHREVVRAQLRDVIWRDGVTIGELLDERCRSSRFGERCERKRGHHGPHVASAPQARESNVAATYEWGGV